MVGEKLRSLNALSIPVSPPTTPGIVPFEKNCPIGPEPPDKKR